jgi:hypothetical protein
MESGDGSPWIYSTLFEIVVVRPANDEAGIPTRVPKFVSGLIQIDFVLG